MRESGKGALCGCVDVMRGREGRGQEGEEEVVSIVEGGGECLDLYIHLILA